MQNSRKISLIVVHCSATRITQNFTVEDLEASHRARGFTGIGYHFYITKDGLSIPAVRRTRLVPMPATTTPIPSEYAMRADWTRTDSLPIPEPRHRRTR